MKKICFCCLILVSSACCHAEFGPWGCDAELAYTSAPVTMADTSTVLATAVKVLVSFHQQVLGTATAPRSHFRPSSSQYMLLAVQKYGVAGILRGMDRLMRENDEAWIYPKIASSPQHVIKWDPP